MALSPLDTAYTPAYTPLMPPLTRRNANSSIRTIPRTFRITHTQDNLLDRPQNKEKASAIVRVLLSLYFNKKIDKMVDDLILKEIQAAKAAELVTLSNFKNKLILQGQRKREGDF